MILISTLAQDISTETMASLAGVLFVIAGAVAIVYWAHAAQDRRDLKIALTILLGSLFGLEALTGLVMCLVSPMLSETPPFSQNDTRALSLSLGLGLVLAAIVSGSLFTSRFRRLLGRITPIAPGSIPDMLALMGAAQTVLVMGAVLLVLDLSRIAETTAGAQSALSYSDLLLQSIPFPVIAFFSCAPFTKRNVGETLKRLGLVVPKVWQIGLAIGIGVAAVAANFLLDWVMSLVQPESQTAINTILEQMLGGLLNPFGAVALGLGAGIGEEMLFRGSLQPRIGIGLTALVFALLHTQYGFTLVTLFVFLFGIVLGLVRQRLNTTSAVVVHATFNTVGVLLSI
jgi:uncharacterized protein